MLSVGGEGEKTFDILSMFSSMLHNDRLKVEVTH